MAGSARLRLSDLHAVHTLTGACRGLGGDPARSRVHWVAGLARLAGAGLVCGREKGCPGPGLRGPVFLPCPPPGGGGAVAHPPRPAQTPAQDRHDRAVARSACRPWPVSGV